MSFGGLGFSTIEVCRLMGLVDEYDRVIGDTQDQNWRPLPPITDLEKVRIRRLGRAQAKAAIRDLMTAQRRDARR